MSGIHNSGSRGPGTCAEVDDREMHLRRRSRPAPGSIDLAFAFGCLHDMPRAVEVLAAVRRALVPDGCMIVTDEARAEEFAPNGDDVERLMSGYSLLVCLPDGMSSQPSVGTGAVGEEGLAHRLNTMASDPLRVLHDRRIPGSTANIDHIAITPTGIYAIDAKRYVGKRPTLKVEGGLLRPRVEKLMVGTRDRTNLVIGVEKQVAVVRRVVGDVVPVIGVLCFVESDWPLVGGAFTIRGSGCCGPRSSIRGWGRTVRWGPMSRSYAGRWRGAPVGVRQAANSTHYGLPEASDVPPRLTLGLRGNNVALAGYVQPVCFQCGCL